MPADRMCASVQRKGLDIVEDRDREDLGLARDVAADHQHHAELADRVSKAEHRASQEPPGGQAGPPPSRTHPAARRASVAATSSGRSPNASKALRIGCTTNGSE